MTDMLGKTINEGDRAWHLHYGTYDKIIEAHVYNWMCDGTLDAQTRKAFYFKDFEDAVKWGILEIEQEAQRKIDALKKQLEEYQK